MLIIDYSFLYFSVYVWVTIRDQRFCWYRQQSSETDVHGRKKRNCHNLRSCQQRFLSPGKIVTCNSQFLTTTFLILLFIILSRLTNVPRIKNAAFTSQQNFLGRQIELFSSSDVLTEATKWDLLFTFRQQYWISFYSEISNFLFLFPDQCTRVHFPDLWLCRWTTVRLGRGQASWKPWRLDPRWSACHRVPWFIAI